MTELVEKLKEFSGKTKYHVVAKQGAWVVWGVSFRAVKKAGETGFEVRFSTVGFPSDEPTHFKFRGKIMYNATIDGQSGAVPGMQFDKHYRVITDKQLPTAAQMSEYLAEIGFAEQAADFVLSEIAAEPGLTTVVTKEDVLDLINKELAALVGPPEPDFTPAEGNPDWMQKFMKPGPQPTNLGGDDDLDPPDPEDEDDH